MDGGDRLTMMDGGDLLTTMDANDHQTTTDVNVRPATDASPRVVPSRHQTPSASRLMITTDGAVPVPETSYPTMVFRETSLVLRATIL
jgi:hypothetical protein